MTASTTPDPAQRRRAKAAVIGLAVVDAIIDLALPLGLVAVLTAAGVRPYFALTAVGVLIGAKASLGRFQDWRADRHAAFVAVMAVVALGALAALPALGAPDVVAAAVCGVLVAVPVIAALRRPDRRTDSFGLFVLAELVVSVVITLISDDPLFVLARPAIYTVVAGIWVFTTCRSGRRPAMLDATKPFAEAGDPLAGEAFENAWLHSPRFRRVQYGMTIGLGVLMLAESVLRVVVVYTAPDASVAVTGLVAQVPGILLAVAFVLGVRVLAVPRATAEVTAQRELLVAGS